MTNPDTYDVALIGYGPTGATAANLLGQLGLKVVVIERDPDIYGRARAISTDEEVMRIWQSIGLADRLQQDMLPDRPLNFVDAAGVPFIDLKIAPRGATFKSMNGTPLASTKFSGRSGSMSCCNRSAKPIDCQIRMTSSSVEIARARL